MYSLITKLICWKTFSNLRDFYLVNLWNFLLGGLGWSSRTVILNMKTDLQSWPKVFDEMPPPPKAMLA